MYILYTIYVNVFNCIPIVLVLDLGSDDPWCLIIRTVIIRQDQIWDPVANSHNHHCSYMNMAPPG